MPSESKVRYQDVKYRFHVTRGRLGWPRPLNCTAPSRSAPANCTSLSAPTLFRLNERNINISFTTLVAMASDFLGWTLDPSRNEYYYYSHLEGAYIYQSGERIQFQLPRPEPTTSSRSVQVGSRRHDTSQPSRDPDPDRERDGAEKLKPATQKDGLSNFRTGYSLDEDPHDAAAFVSYGLSAGKLNGQQPCLLDCSAAAFAKYIYDCICRPS
jgi:hypothetical protein